MCRTVKEVCREIASGPVHKILILHNRGFGTDGRESFTRAINTCKCEPGELRLDEYQGFSILAAFRDAVMRTESPPIH